MKPHVHQPSVVEFAAGGVGKVLSHVVVLRGLEIPPGVQAVVTVGSPELRYVGEFITPKLHVQEFRDENLMADYSFRIKILDYSFSCSHCIYHYEFFSHAKRRNVDQSKTTPTDFLESMCI